MGNPPGVCISDRGPVVLQQVGRGASVIKVDVSCDYNVRGYAEGLKPILQLGVGALRARIYHGDPLVYDDE